MYTSNIIYAFIDPITKQIRYIGKTTRGYERILEHFCPANIKIINPKNNWIRGLLEKGTKPDVIIVDQTDTEESLNQLEIFYIGLFRRCGVSLLNHTDGGDGVTGLSLSEESRLKISRSLKGRQTAKAHPFICEQTNEIFRTLAECAEKLKLNFQSVNKQLSGGARHVKGLSFRYLSEAEIKSRIVKTEIKPFVQHLNRRNLTNAQAFEAAKKFSSRSKCHSNDRCAYDLLTEEQRTELFGPPNSGHLKGKRFNKLTRKYE